MGFRSAAPGAVQGGSAGSGPVLTPDVVAIDPGTQQSALLVLRADRSIDYKAILPNPDILEWLRSERSSRCGHVLAIEMIASYGMPVGREIFETCVWIGRMAEAARPMRVEFVYRRDVKLHLCGSARAKDGNVRQALIDKLGAPGTKRTPGSTYGLAGDLWAALAVAVVWHEQQLSR